MLFQGMSNEQAFISYVGRFNYDYKGRYLLELGFRNDGSYRYAPGSRWAFFPMGSIGWRLSEEKFLKEKLGFLDNLKIRASYGESDRMQVIRSNMCRGIILMLVFMNLMTELPLRAFLLPLLRIRI